MKTIKVAERSNVADVARSARTAARVLANLSNEQRNQALEAAAAAITEHQAEILAANYEDCQTAERALATGEMSRALFDRLRTSERGIEQMAAGVRSVANLPDPLGRELAVTKLDDDLTLYRESCSLGVVGIIFESRPDVVPQVAALALKSGNAVLLKGGSEAMRTNEVLVSIWQNALGQFPEIPTDAVSLLRTRDDVNQMLALDDLIDLIIPRGSTEFVRYIAAHSRIPVLGHGKGLCHVYVDQAADLRKAEEVVFDAKVQYPAACNAVETLLVHQGIASSFLPGMIERLDSAEVEVRGCPQTIRLINSNNIIPANDGDWATEYSDLILSVRIVSSLDEAINHIHLYGSGHTESIVTEDADTATQFMNQIDAAGVYHNVSTRFSDGFRYGFGAELGISTGKLHARGPVGLEGLTTYKYKLFGDGHTVAEYTSGKRTFKHK